MDIYNKCTTYAGAFVWAFFSFASATEAQAAADCPALLDHRIRPLMAKSPVRLCERYAGRVLLVVNTASECVYPPQYAELVELSVRYRELGLVVLGLPSNDFGNQEPDGEKNIARFCRVKFGVNFPMFEKVRVVGVSAHPFYRALAEATGEVPRWNFHKYLVSPDGQIVESYPSHVSPTDRRIIGAIDRALAKLEHNR